MSRDDLYELEIPFELSPEQRIMRMLEAVDGSEGTVVACMYLLSHQGQQYSVKEIFQQTVGDEEIGNEPNYHKLSRRVEYDLKKRVVPAGLVTVTHSKYGSAEPPQFQATGADTRLEQAALGLLMQTSAFSLRSLLGVEVGARLQMYELLLQHGGKLKVTALARRMGPGYTHQQGVVQLRVLETEQIVRRDPASKNVDLSSEARPVVQALVDGWKAIAGDEATTLEQYIAIGERVLSSSAVVEALLCKDAVPSKLTPAKKQELRTHILALVQGIGRLTVNDTVTGLRQQNIRASSEVVGEMLRELTDERLIVQEINKNPADGITYAVPEPEKH